MIDDDDWSPERDIEVPRDIVAEVDPALVNEPDGVAARKAIESSYLADMGEETQTAPVMRAPQPTEIPAPTQGLSQADRDWLALRGELEPGVVQMIRRKPSEFVDYLRWLQHIGAYRESKPKELRLRLGSYAVELSVPYVVSQQDGLTEIYFLPLTANSLRMPPGAPLFVIGDTPEQDREMAFAGWFELPAFPYKLMMLVRAEA